MQILIRRLATLVLAGAVLGNVVRTPGDWRYDLQGVAPRRCRDQSCRLGTASGW